MGITPTIPPSLEKRKSECSVSEVSLRRPMPAAYMSQEGPPSGATSVYTRPQTPLSVGSSPYDLPPTQYLLTPFQYVRTSGEEGVAPSYEASVRTEEQSQEMVGSRREPPLPDLPREAEGAREVVREMPREHQRMMKMLGPWGGLCVDGQVHHFQREFSPLGGVLALILFPIGIVCCVFMRDRRCAKCQIVNRWPH